MWRTDALVVLERLRRTYGEGPHHPQKGLSPAITLELGTDQGAQCLTCPRCGAYFSGETCLMCGYSIRGAPGSGVQQPLIINQRPQKQPIGVGGFLIAILLIIVIAFFMFLLFARSSMGGNFGLGLPPSPARPPPPLSP